MVFRQRSAASRLVSQEKVPELSLQPVEPALSGRPGSGERFRSFAEAERHAPVTDPEGGRAMVLPGRQRATQAAFCRVRARPSAVKALREAADPVRA